MQYLSRLIAQRFRQKADVDYEETFSHVVRHSSLRLFLAISVHLDLDLDLRKTVVFLNSNIGENICMPLPQRFSIGLKFKKGHMS